MPLTNSSTAFTHKGEISKQYTCDGEDRSPPLAWSSEPAGAGASRSSWRTRTHLTRKRRG